MDMPQKVYASILIHNDTPHVIKFLTKCDFTGKIIGTEKNCRLMSYAFCFKQTGRFLLDRIAKSIYTGGYLPFLECGIREAGNVYPTYFYYKGERRIVEIESEDLIPSEVLGASFFLWLQIKADVKLNSSMAIMPNGKSSVILVPSKFPDVECLSLENKNQLEHDYQETVRSTSKIYIADETVHRSNKDLKLTVTLYDKSRLSPKWAGLDVKSKGEV